MGSLEGRHVVVTGAGRGIGKAIALRLARDGARLSLVARGVDALQATAAEAGGAFVHGADIRDTAQVDAAFAAAAGANGPMHALVANSGIGGPNGPGDGGDRFADLVATNLGGTYACVRAAQRHLEPGPDRRDVVVIASILARIGVSGYTGYCASKAGLLGLVRSLAAELAPENVQVNAICPGWVDTDMAWEGIGLLGEALGVTRDEAYAQAMREVPLGRMSRPEDIAGTVAWLLSPDARGVTGQAVDQNGGAVMP
ncbi:MAG TPA: SDR family NAD(P)-dependent oxidoreductase [Gaiellaceae bacterium]|nr:SDR family NAD(P)-dependent oxidoreductase [Gaiellaceae bacterium]